MLKEDLLRTTIYYPYKLSGSWGVKGGGPERANIQSGGNTSAKILYWPKSK